MSERFSGSVREFEENPTAPSRERVLRARTGGGAFERGRRGTIRVRRRGTNNGENEKPETRRRDEGNNHLKHRGFVRWVPITRVLSRDNVTVRREECAIIQHWDTRIIIIFSFHECQSRVVYVRLSDKSPH